MQTLKHRASQGSSELLICADGRILAHNLTGPLAEALAALNPRDTVMRRRARAGAHS